MSKTKEEKKKTLIKQAVDLVKGKSEGKEVTKVDSPKKDEKPKEPKAINYEPIDSKNPQLVRDFGPDKHSQNSKDMVEVVGFIINTKKLDQFNADYIRQLFLKHTKVDFAALYSKDYPCSPIHTALHALAKSETDECKDNKDGKNEDTFARGQRGFLYKTNRVGLKYPDGLYMKNPSIKYPDDITEGKAKAAMLRIIDRCNRCNQ